MNHCFHCCFFLSTYFTFSSISYPTTLHLLYSDQPNMPLIFSLCFHFFIFTSQSHFVRIHVSYIFHLDTWIMEIPWRYYPSLNKWHTNHCCALFKASKLGTLGSWIPKHHVHQYMRSTCLTPIVKCILKAIVFERSEEENRSNFEYSFCSLPTSPGFPYK